MGGSLLALSGPCFSSISSMVCDFGHGFVSDIVFASPLRAYCAIPLLDLYGVINLILHGEINDGQHITYNTSQPFTSGRCMHAVSTVLLNEITLDCSFT